MSDYNAPQKLLFKIEGPGLQEELNLYDIITTLTEFHSIIDKSYCVITGKQRLTRSEREFYKIQISEFKHGSFMAILEIIITGMTLTLPLLGMINPYTIWEYTRYSFLFLKAIYTAYTSNQNTKPQIIAGDNSNVIVITGDNNNIILPDARIIDLANRTKRNYKKLAGILNEDGIHNIMIASPDLDNTGIVLNLSEKNLFKTSTKIVPKPIEIVADIFNFNKVDNTGKLRVLEGQAIPMGEYSFTVIGNQETSNYIQSMLYNSVNIVAIEEYEDDPINGIKLLRLKVIQVKIAS